MGTFPIYIYPLHTAFPLLSLSLCIAIIKSIDKVFPAAPSTDKINSISSRDNQLLFHNLSSHANCTFDAAICDYLSGIIIPFAGRGGHAPFSLCMAVNQPASQLLAPPAGSPVWILCAIVLDISMRRSSTIWFSRLDERFSRKAMNHQRRYRQYVAVFINVYPLTLQDYKMTVGLAQEAKGAFLVSN